MTTAVISDYLEGMFLNYVLRSVAFSSPTSVYLALFTATPSDAGGGTEVSGGTYSRFTLTGAFDVASAGATQNTAIITFPTATAVWGLVTSVGIFDAITGGNLLFYGSFGSNLQVDTGDTLSIAAGALDISLGGDIGTFLANEMLDHILKAATFTQPAAAWLTLYTTMPNAADSGGVEVTGGAYARVTCHGAAKWDAPTATGGDTENTATETFPVATADWGTVVGMGIRTANAAGSLLFFKTLTASKTVYNGDTFRFSAGAIDIVLS